MDDGDIEAIYEEIINFRQPHMRHNRGDSAIMRGCLMPSVNRRRKAEVDVMTVSVVSAHGCRAPDCADPLCIS